MKLKIDWEIFKYHFPEYALFPGALILDFFHCRSKEMQCPEIGHSSIRFYKSLYPGDHVEFQSRAGTWCVLRRKGSCDEVCVAFETDNDIAGVDNQPSPAPYFNTGYEPIANNSKEIFYLDTWKFGEIDNISEVSAYGSYYYSLDDILFLREIYDHDRFGQVFLLVEFMSLTALSAMSAKKNICCEDYYGFVRIQGFHCNEPIADGDRLVSSVVCRMVGKALIWRGVVYKNEKPIAYVKQASNLPIERE